MSVTLHMCAENWSLMLSWPLMLLFIFVALGIEHIGILHIDSERKEPVLLACISMLSKLTHTTISSGCKPLAPQASHSICKLWQGLAGSEGKQISCCL